MVILKKNLSFLGIYTLLSSKVNKLSDKLQIIYNEEGCYFNLFTDKISLIKKIDLNPDIQPENKEYFTASFDVFIFSNLIKLIVNEDEEISITGNGISLKNIANHTLENHILSFPAFQEFLNITETFQEKYNLSDLKKLDTVFEFAGDNLLEVSQLNNGHFVASDNKQIGCVIKTTNDPSIKLYIPRILFLIIHKFGLSELTLKRSEMYTYIFINDIHFFIKNQPYRLMDYFSDDAKKYYEHDFFLKIKTQDILLSLRRISVSSDSKTIAFTVTGNKLTMGSNFSSSNIENIEILEKSEEIKDVKFSCFSDKIVKALSKLKSPNVIIRHNNEEKCNLIKLESEDQNLFFVIALTKLI